MRLLIAALLLLLPLQAWSQASWVQIGDPQYGLNCNGTYDSATSALDFRYNDLGPDECLEQQMTQLVALLAFAEDKNVDFVMLMGDMNHAFGTNRNVGSATRLKMGEALALFPTLDIRWTIGNHDYESGCQFLNAYMLDWTSSGVTDRTKLWQNWTINNVHFSNIPVSLYSASPDCTAGDQTRCEDIAGTPGAACLSQAADEEMVSTCLADEFCTDLTGYYARALTDLTAQITAWAAVGPKARLFTFSHWPPWWAHDTTTPPAGGFTTANIQAIEDIVDTGTTSVEKPFMMMFGHWHQNSILGQDVSTEWPNEDPVLANGITNRKGVFYSSISSTGPAFGKYLTRGEKDKLAGMYWKVDREGNHEMTRIIASPQQGALR